MTVLLWILVVLFFITLGLWIYALTKSIIGMCKRDYELMDKWAIRQLGLVILFNIFNILVFIVGKIVY